MKIPLTPIRYLYRGVDLYGKKTGVISGQQRFTYEQFGERCERLAAGIQKEGAVRGDRIAYLSFNNHQLLEGYYGIPLTGAIVMPLNVRLTPAELTVILNHAEPHMMIFEGEFGPFIRQFRAACPSIVRYVSIGDLSSEADISYDELLSHGRMDRPDFFSFNEDEIAEIFYTSGSTGMPKGVALSHRTVYLHALNAAVSLRPSDSDVELHTIPLFHANGWGRAHIAVMTGAKQVMVRRFEPAQVLRLIEEEKVTGMSLVPAMANAMLNYSEFPQFDCSSLREIYLGGAASSPELIARMEHAFRCDVLVGYGLTETSPIVSTSHQKSTVRLAGEQDRLDRRASAGWPILGNEIRVVNTNMKDVPQDRQTVGEVIVRADNVMDGYYRDPQTTECAISDGWLHTGDMATWDSDMYIKIVDRKKDIIISGGENISSIEVENAIFAHPAVLECAVVAAPDPKWGEVPAAFIVLKPNCELQSHQLLTFLEERIAKFKIPRIMKFVTTPLPKTGTGKILKRDLREAFWIGKQLRVQG
jgi:fatty-acyl-CoA synthase